MIIKRNFEHLLFSKASLRRKCNHKSATKVFVFHTILNEILIVYIFKYGWSIFHYRIFTLNFEIYNILPYVYKKTFKHH